jgi:hypothetical protein
VTEVCEQCKLFKGKTHVCGGRFCFNCKRMVEANHQCYIKTEKERSEQNKNKKERKLNGYIFFDYECQIEGFHVPNLIIADIQCINCVNEQACVDKCGIVKFNNNKEFCRWLIDQDGYIAMAHNMRAYDGHFIMNFLINDRLPRDKVRNILINQSKILTIDVNKMKIIDSYNFIPFALGKFPNAFNLELMAKGYFPHLFNKKENENKVLPHHPPIENYQDKFMMHADRVKFLKWYEENKNNKFDFNFELDKYCSSDVDILKRGALKFRKLFLELTKIDPFAKSITIASLCQLVYRTMFMKPNTIPLIQDNGFHPTQNYSHKQIIWLKYVSETQKIRIDHCMNGNEKKIGPYSIDGFCEQTNTVFEFDGCFVHGCPTCFKETTFNPLQRCSMGYLYERHVSRKKYIIQCGYLYESIWEHEWDSLVETDENVRQFVKKTDIQPCIKPRDALFGGRTNAVKLYHECSEDERIDYYDVTSLYPWVQRTKSFPIGKIKIITEKFDNIDKYFGLIQCRVLAPRKLNFPILPVRVNGKLLFTLCFSCANEKKRQCNHSQKHRELNGTWVSEEVKLALAYGYEIIKIHSVWHFEERSDDLFKDYVNMFFTTKLEASGFPDWVKTEQDKDKYVDNYSKKNIFIDKTRIEKNEGLRTISKLLLNSQWGKYCLNTNKQKYMQTNNASDVNHILLNSQYVLKQINCPNERTAQVWYEDVDDLHMGGRDNNVIIGAFVTAYGRIRLYEEIAKLGERVLYFDTDSIIFSSKAGQYKPELGENLGMWTSELAENDYIYQFVSGGPKNYGYQTKNGETVCKCKGLTLNHAAENVVNFNTIKQVVLNEIDEDIYVDQLRFVKDKKSWNIRTEEIRKIYRQVYDKRMLNDDLTTLPWGY